MVIAAQRDDDNKTNSGSAYVFTRVTAGDLTSGWTQVDKLTAGDGAAGDFFGMSVSIDGDTMVIGAPYDDDMGSISGSAYVFTRVTAGNLGSKDAGCQADRGSAAEDRFGRMTCRSTDTMVIVHGPIQPAGVCVRVQAPHL